MTLSVLPRVRTLKPFRFKGGGETYPPRWSRPPLPRSYPLAGPGNWPHRGCNSIQPKESSGHRKSQISSAPRVAIQAVYLHENFEEAVATVGQTTCHLSSLIQYQSTWISSQYDWDDELWTLHFLSLHKVLSFLQLNLLRQLCPVSVARLNLA